MTVQTRRFPLPRLLSPLSLLTLSILLLAGCGEKKRPISGEIPPVNLESFSGEKFILDAGQKDATLLVFWASWCGPCLMEIPALIKLHEKYRDRNFQVVGINVDDPSALPKAKDIASEYGINYPTLIGNQETMRVFGNVNALPTSFLIGKDGRIRQKFQGLRSEEELEAHILELLGTKG
jgi:thiol-disulfide isomerase/thioredoxin